MGPGVGTVTRLKERLQIFLGLVGFFAAFALASMWTGGSGL